jgi:hypothetical protein
MIYAASVACSKEEKGTVKFTHALHIIEAEDTDTAMGVAMVKTLKMHDGYRIEGVLVMEARLEDEPRPALKPGADRTDLGTTEGP